MKECGAGGSPVEEIDDVDRTAEPPTVEELLLRTVFGADVPEEFSVVTEASLITQKSFDTKFQPPDRA
jgi:hypothetical protein